VSVWILLDGMIELNGELKKREEKRTMDGCNFLDGKECDEWVVVYFATKDGRKGDLRG
jgi:hypothetical protein